VYHINNNNDFELQLNSI